MKKWISVLLTICMKLSLFGGVIVVNAANDYETVQLNGFNNWTQAELDKSSGNNGSAESLYFDDITLVEMGVKTPDLISGGQTSRTEESGTGLGLAFKFNIAADGIAVTNGNVVDLSAATVTIGGEAYRLVEFGAVMSNDAAIGTDADKFNLDNLSTKTIKITAKYLMDVAEDNASYAVRVINIPKDEADTIVYARAYYIYEDAEGNQVAVYDEIYSSTYAG